MAEAAQNALRRGTQVLVPIDQQMKEFIQTGEEWAKKERNPQRHQAVLTVLFIKPPRNGNSANTFISDAIVQVLVGPLCS